MLEKPYRGNDNYVFISYSHHDLEEVRRFIETLQKNGYNVWYDEGIDPGTEWDENIAAHIKNCACFVAFVTNDFINSQNCKDELTYARDLDKERILIYGEDVDLPEGMKMRMNRLQAIYKYKYEKESDFYAKVFYTQGLNACRTDSTTEINPDLSNLEKQVPKKKSFNTKLVLIAVAAIVILGIGVFALTNTNTTPEESKTETTENAGSGTETADEGSSDSTDSEKAAAGEDVRETNIVLEDNDKISVTIVSYDDAEGKVAVRIKNKTDGVISSYQEGESVLLDGSKQCIGETDGTHSFAYIDVPANSEMTIFSSFRENADDGWEKIIKPSDNHTFEFVMCAADEDWNEIALYSVKLTPDMFGYGV